MPQLIARRVREQHVYCEIVRHNISAAARSASSPAGHHPLRRAGERVRAGRSRSATRRSFDLGIPVLGICYGMQLVCEALGGKVESAPAREYGRAHARVISHADLFDGVADETEVWMSHGDQVSQVSRRIHRRWPDTSTCPIAAVQASHAADLRPAVSSGSDAHAAGREVLANFLTAFAAAPAPGGWATLPSKPIEASASRWATAA